MTKVTVDVEERLAAIPYLAPLPARERADLASRCVVKRIAKGETIFAEGEPATGLWVILAGRVRLVRISPRGREQALHVESAGATLAEVPLFDGGGYVATALAEEDAHLLFVPRPVLLDLCRRRPEIALGVIAVLARRVRTFAAVMRRRARRAGTGTSSTCREPVKSWPYASALCENWCRVRSASFGRPASSTCAAAACG